MPHYTKDEQKQLGFAVGNTKCHWCHKKNDGTFDLYGKNRDNSLVYVCDKCYKKHVNELHSFTKKVKLK